MEDENIILCDKYSLGKKIGEGSFGEIYFGIDIETKREVAVKVEPPSINVPQLIAEAKIIRSLDKGIGIPKVIWYGTRETTNYMVMEMLGQSLEDKFKLCNRKFSIKTTVMIADQIITRIEYVHTNSIIHRDIKPDNFMTGINKRANLIYIIDFGLSKKYRDPKTKQHIPYKENRSLTGTARYASVNAHMGIELSRRDDLESIGYLFVYFTKGELPWQRIQCDGKKEKYKKIMESKYSTPVEVLCRGLPIEFVEYLLYCKSLRFDEKPDYDYLRGLLRKVALDQNFTLDLEFDWIIIDKKTHQSETADSSFVRTRPKYHRVPQPFPYDMGQESDSQNDSKTITRQSYIGPEFNDKQKILDGRRDFLDRSFIRRNSVREKANKSCHIF
ncbi:unnamed protein product [Blepharisma stoltei]|uniref:Casein kinase I n=1 Tax=Blepharisma stoltei TaxID=1481888 RepID=A0AAU9JTQ0_9CILI|nr:unnamed protein product [Blepharisma stoltei]